MRRCVGALTATVLASLFVGGCGSPDAWSGPHRSPSPVGALKSGFVDVAATPAPESTITPAPGSWDDVRPGRGYRVVLLSAGADPQTRVLREAVASWADENHVSLRRVDASDSVTRLDRVDDAVALSPDLIVCVGNDLVDALATVTASHLSQQFLIVGAEVAEPTENVTAADWAGASFRGEGLGMSSTYDPGSFTPERAGRALRAGVASVLTRHTGIVLWLS